MKEENKGTDDAVMAQQPGEADASKPAHVDQRAKLNDDGPPRDDNHEGEKGVEITKDGKDADGKRDVADNPNTPGTMEFPKKLLAKIDRRLLISMFFLNFISLMGRTNIGATLIRSMPMDLQLDAEKIFIVLVMPTAPLILFEVPSNLLMRLMERKLDFSYIHYMCLLDFVLGESALSFFPRSQSS